MIIDKMKPRLIRVVDFVAEMLEEEAATTPYKEQAKSLYRSAETYREINYSKLVRVWEETPSGCLKLKALREERRRLLTENASAERLDAINAQIADHRKFWHPHNCEPDSPGYNELRTQS